MRRILSVAFGIIYLFAFLFSLVVLIKPGSSVFYKKIPVQPQELAREGPVLTCSFDVDVHVFDPQTTMVWEDGKPLASVYVKDLLSGESGIFALKEITSQQITVSFVPADISGAANSGHSYLVYIRPYLINSNTAGLILMLLILVGAGFWGPLLTQSERRRAVLASPLDAWRVRWAAKGPAVSAIQPRSQSIKQGATNGILAAFLYVFLEWIFLVTKTSFMDYLDWGQKIRILLITGLGLSLLVLLSLVLLFLVEVLANRIFPGLRAYIYHVPAAFLAACLILILVDNFTYTIFRFGIVDSITLVRMLYALTACGVFLYLLRQWARPANTARFKMILAIVLLAASGTLAVFTFNPQAGVAIVSNSASTLTHKPNIILLSIDGVNADHMSVYGYQRDTTPFLKEFATTSLVSQNNFTNASTSPGSETSLLTGKLPLATHFLYPPDTLKGSDVYQHLPGLLKSYGYRTISLGLEYYVDANYANFKNAFDYVNGHENPADDLTGRISGLGYGEEVYFFTYLEDRIEVRLGHIFFIKDMQNIYSAAVQPSRYGVTDQERLDTLTAFLEDSRRTGQPLFAHLHLMGTHGSEFDPDVRVFSAGEVQDQEWMTDFYDDAILTFDNQMNQLVQYLKESGQYDHTLLIFYTDHGQQWMVDRRLPLLLHFPQSEHAGILTENTQNLDIAPTILDYLGVQKPAWMQGDSLLGTLNPNRLIIAALTDLEARQRSGDNLILDPEVYQPPFFQFSNLAVIQCQNIYAFNLQNLTVHTSQVLNDQNPCSPNDLDSEDEIRSRLGELLEQLGYQIPENW